ncbi:lipid droplet-associated perilipin protein [Crepidotus variabilis]|uniref:Lipid droplet-associated perilipin protein n=1 Tax=Crepidotus variabilis TaxID=179855 RepID=A0A9P6EF55_9AGAR|nr:lipid droplet-associated perilipin protein [Crepidotus variabilis]
MSTTATETKPAGEQHAPEITVISRMGSIPLISSSLVTLNDALVNNAYTRSPYAHAKTLSSTAYRLSEPIQCKLAPLILRVDGLANNLVDAVQSRYPYPFEAQPEEVATYVRETKDNTINGVNKAIDDRVKTPALHVAQGIDQRFTPLVNYFETAVNRFNNSDEGPSNPPDATYQYQRALALTSRLGGTVYVYSNEQLKQIQAQSVLVQKAQETAGSITAVASSSLASAQAHIHGLSDNMIAELQKIQASTSQLAASFQANVHDSAAQIQSSLPQIQQSFAELAQAVGETTHHLKDIVVQKDLPIQEKVSRVSKEVQDRIAPLLDTIKNGLSEALAKSKETKDSATNGNSNGHAENGHVSESK